MEKSYISKFSDSARQDFLNQLPKFFGDGNGTAEITTSSDKSIVVSLFDYNESGERVRVLIFELFDFYCELKWLDSRAFVVSNLENINKFWVRTLNAKFDTYKQDYLNYHANLINGV